MFACSVCFRAFSPSQGPSCPGCVNPIRRICLECSRKHLLKREVSSCPICSSHWDYRFLEDTFSSQWVNEVYLPNLKKSILKREEERLPQTLSEIKGDHLYVFRCTRVSCKGMIDFDQSECILCGAEYCLCCGEMKENHRPRGLILSPPSFKEEKDPINPYYRDFNSDPLSKGCNDPIKIVKLDQLLGCPLFPRDQEIVSIYHLGVDLNSLLIQAQEEKERIEKKIFNTRKRWIENQITGTEFQRRLYRLKLEAWSNRTQLYLSRASRDVVVTQINLLYERHLRNLPLDLEWISRTNNRLIRVIYPLIQHYNRVSRGEMKLLGSKKPWMISLFSGGWILKSREDIKMKKPIPVI